MRGLWKRLKAYCLAAEAGDGRRHVDRL